jgi:HNH endonuclease
VANRNKHGLARKVPEQVCRQLRQEAGFGCVVCGLAIAQYEHIDPEFAHATEHDPANMALLCGHCHDKVNKKYLSKQAVKEAKIKPKARQLGFSHDTFDIGSDWPTIEIGDFRFVNCTNMIVVDERVIMSARPPEEAGGPFRISAQLIDDSGIERMSIVDNVWNVNNLNWDVIAKRKRIIFRDKDKNIKIQIHVRDRTLIFEKLQIEASGHSFIFDENGFRMESAWGEIFRFSKFEMGHCKSGIVVEGPILAIAADGGIGFYCSGQMTIVNRSLQNQDQIREIFTKKMNKYGVAFMTDPSMGGTQPRSFSKAHLTLR